MTKENKRNIFSLLAANFETEEFKNYYLDMVENIPDYIFTMPSSTTGKFHNAKQCETYGQIYHIFMFDSVLNHRLKLKHNQELYSTSEERDAMRCVPTFHDAIKCGLNGSQYTVQDHPVLAKEWVLQTKTICDIPDNYKQMIADMCETHSGQWNKSRSGKVIMPEPRNDREFFIHECDILASRADLDYIIPVELTDILKNNIAVTLPDPNTYVMPFGKYKGYTIKEIADKDSDYIRWAKENITKQPFKDLFKMYDGKR